MYTARDFHVHYRKFSAPVCLTQPVRSEGMDPMKTHMDIDAELLANAMKLGGHRTKREAVETALQRYVQWRARQELLTLRGKVKWVGDLDEMRGRSRPTARK